MHFTRKDYGRIFTNKEENIPHIEEIIKDMDEFEYEYLPEGFIGVFDSDDVRTVYTHKFDSLDTNELTRRCWAEGIMIFCWFGSANIYEHRY
jgi:nicotinamide riboside kinase